MIAKLDEHMRQGSVRSEPCDLLAVLFTGERISKARTFVGGHRSFDLLHVATALELGAKAFLSFDSNQIRLASAEGLETPLAEA